MEEKSLINTEMRKRQVHLTKRRPFQLILSGVRTWFAEQETGQMGFANCATDLRHSKIKMRILILRYIMWNGCHVVEETAQKIQLRYVPIAILRCI